MHSVIEEKYRALKNNFGRDIARAIMNVHHIQAKYLEEHKNKFASVLDIINNHFGPSFEIIKSNIHKAVNSGPPYLPHANYELVQAFGSYFVFRYLFIHRRAMQLLQYRFGLFEDVGQPHEYSEYRCFGGKGKKRKLNLLRALYMENPRAIQYVCFERIIEKKVEVLGPARWCIIL